MSQDVCGNEKTMICSDVIKHAVLSLSKKYHFKLGAESRKKQYVVRTCDEALVFEMSLRFPARYKMPLTNCAVDECLHYNRIA